MYPKAFSFLFILLNLCALAEAQVPDTDIYIANFSFEEDKLIFDKLHNITNRTGYDNQPFFHPENKWLYFSSIRNEGQSDVYRYEWENNRTYRVTETFEDEFSPQMIPGKNAFSTVRVELNQKQRLWQFDILNPSMPELLIPDVERVGYSAWIDKYNLILFLVAQDEKEHELLHVNLKNSKKQLIDKHIARGFAVRHEKKQLLYVSNEDSSNWELKLFNPINMKKEVVGKALAKSEDYCWINTNLLITGNGKVIYGMNMNKEEKVWVPLLDLNNKLSGSIERIAINPKYNRLALVVNKDQ